VGILDRFEAFSETVMMKGQRGNIKEFHSSGEDVSKPLKSAAFWLWRNGHKEGPTQKALPKEAMLDFEFFDIPSLAPV
jgi:hypothetical protein